MFICYLRKYLPKLWCFFSVFSVFFRWWFMLQLSSLVLVFVSPFSWCHCRVKCLAEFAFYFNLCPLHRRKGRLLFIFLWGSFTVFFSSIKNYAVDPTFVHFEMLWLLSGQLPLSTCNLTIRLRFISQCNMLNEVHCLWQMPLILSKLALTVGI